MKLSDAGTHPPPWTARKTNLSHQTVFTNLKSQIWPNISIDYATSLPFCSECMRRTDQKEPYRSKAVKNSKKSKRDAYPPVHTPFRWRAYTLLEMSDGLPMNLRSEVRQKIGKRNKKRKSETISD